MGLVFRRYRPGDEEGITELLRRCFNSFNSWGITARDWLYFEDSDYGFRRENALIAEYDGRIVGHVHVVYRRIRIGSAYVDVGGIANVSTHPEFRGRGIATKLMSMALELCKEKNWPLSSLLTGYASAGYRVYRSLGYTDTFFLYEYKGTRESAEKALEVLRAPDVEFDELREDNLDDVVRLYDSWSKRFSGAVWRPLDYWRERIFSKTFYYSYFYDIREAGIRIVAKKNGRVVGYALAILGSRMTREYWYWAKDTGVVLEVIGEEPYYSSALLRRIIEILLKENTKVFRLYIPFDRAYAKALKSFVRCRGAIYMDYIVDQTKLFEALVPELQSRLRESGLDIDKVIDIYSPFGCTELVIDRDSIGISSSCRSSEKVVFDRDGIARLVYGIESFRDMLVSGGIERIDLDRKGIALMRALFPRRKAYVSLIDQW